MSTYTLKLTGEQRSDLTWLLSVNARRDVEKERDAYAALAADPAFTDEQRHTFASNHRFYVEMVDNLAALRELVDNAERIRA